MLRVHDRRAVDEIARDAVDRLTVAYWQACDRERRAIDPANGASGDASLSGLVIGKRGQVVLFFPAPSNCTMPRLRVQREIRLLSGVARAEGRAKI